MIQELEAFSFNTFTHYVFLLLTAAAFFVVGWRKKLDIFQLSLLVIASVIAFRTQRDAWFLAIAATVFIADFRSAEARTVPVLNLAELAGTGAVTALFVYLVAANLSFTTRDLDRAISLEYPVGAANFVRQNPFPGPLYNTLDGEDS